MPVSIITLEDLAVFKAEILQEIEELLMNHNRITIDKWIKSNVVMDKLGISPGTLQNLRINGILPFSKIGGIIYYNEEKINEIFLDNSINIKS